MPPAVVPLIAGASSAVPAVAAGVGVKKGIDSLENRGGGSGRYAGAKPISANYGGRAAKEEQSEMIPAKQGEPGAVYIPGANGMPGMWMKKNVTQAAEQSGAELEAQRQQKLGADYASKYGRMAQQGIPIDSRAADQARALQMDAYGREADVISGKAPSLAEAQLRAGMTRANSMGRSMAAGATGGAAAQANALRMAAAQANANAMGVNEQTAALRASEQAQARQNMASIAGQTRGADEGRSLTSAQIQAQNRQAMSQMELGARSGFEGQAGRVREAQLGADVTTATASEQAKMGEAQLESQREHFNAQRGDNFLKFALGTGASLFGKGSDPGLKTNIKPLTGGDVKGSAPKPTRGKNVGGQTYSIDKSGHQSFLPTFGGPEIWQTPDVGGGGGGEEDPFAQGMSVGSSFAGLFGRGGHGIGEKGNDWSESAAQGRAKEQLAQIPGAGQAAEHIDQVSSSNGPTGTVSDSAKKARIRALNEEGRAKRDAGFSDWYAEHARANGLDPNPDAKEHKYDYRAAYAAGVGPDASGHWPSEFKADDHPNRYIRKSDGSVLDSKYGKYVKDPLMDQANQMQSGLMASMQGPPAVGPQAPEKDAKVPKKPRVSDKEAAKLSKEADAAFNTPMAQMNRSIKPYEYEYKPGAIPGEPPGKKRVGIMADELERTPQGASLVSGPPGQRVVDTQHAALTSLAGLADLQRQVDALRTGAGAPSSVTRAKRRSDEQDASIASRLRRVQGG